MKKFILCILSLTLLGCQSSPKLQFDLVHSSIEPIKLMIENKRNLPVINKYTIGEANEINEWIEFFNRMDKSYQVFNNEDYDYMFVFEDLQERQLHISLNQYRYYDDSTLYRMCLVEENTCQDVNIDDDIETLLNDYSRDLTKSYRFATFDGYLIEKYLNYLLLIEESYSSPEEISDVDTLIYCLIKLTDSQLSEFYYEVENHVATDAMGTGSLNHAYFEESFDFYPFSVIEDTGKMIFGSFELPNLNSAELWKERDLKIYVDPINQGFQVVNNYDWHGQTQKKAMAIEKIVPGSKIEYLVAYVDTLQETIIQSNGRLLKHTNFEDEIMLPADKLEQFDLYKVYTDHDMVLSVEKVQKANRVKGGAPISKSDFMIVEETSGSFRIHTDSNFIDLELLENVGGHNFDSLEIVENDDYLSIKGVTYKEPIYFLFDRHTGDSLNGFELNERLNKNLTKQISSKLNLDVCPRYYEESYLVKECYDEVKMDESQEPYLVLPTPFYINDDGKLAVQCVIRNFGSFVRFEEILIEE